MAILKKRVTVYQVQCGVCGYLAPGADDLEEALLLAEEEGLTLYSRWTGLAYISEALCEACQEFHEHDGKYGDMEPIQAEELAKLLEEPSLKKLKGLFQEEGGASPL